MKIKLLGAICVVVLMLPGLQKASAQEYHTLSTQDFRGNPHRTGDVIAHTHCTINFHYEANPINGYYQLSFDIRLVMNREQSWLDIARITSQDQLAEVLKHEQGHYAICYMEQQELLRTVGKTVFSANYRREAQDILDRIDARYKQLNYDYDADTQHMVNRVQQNSWNIYFDKKLNYMPPLTASN